MLLLSLFGSDIDAFFLMILRLYMRVHTDIHHVRDEHGSHSVLCAGNVSLRLHRCVRPPFRSLVDPAVTASRFDTAAETRLSLKALRLARRGVVNNPRGSDLPSAPRACSSPKLQLLPAADRRCGAHSNHIIRAHPSASFTITKTPAPSTPSAVALSLSSTTSTQPSPVQDALWTRAEFLKDMERIADAYELDGPWSETVRGTHAASAHANLEPQQILDAAARFLLSSPLDASVIVAGLPAIQALWNVLASEVDDGARALSEPLEASALLTAAVCSIFLLGNSYAQAAYSGAHLVASVTNPTNPAGFCVIDPQQPAEEEAAREEEEEERRLHPRRGLYAPLPSPDPAEAARVVAAAMSSHPTLPDVAGAACLSLGNILSMDWCGCRTHFSCTRQSA